jgi:hypothetical protein
MIIRAREKPLLFTGWWAEMLVVGFAGDWISEDLNGLLDLWLKLLVIRVRRNGEGDGGVASNEYPLELENGMVVSSCLVRVVL